ncbi:MAG: hypothetical protein HYZ14_05320 [Bacteroidetes bacterium]|nr:hypothetical protein [Bacteroidota bacterium]
MSRIKLDNDIKRIKECFPKLKYLGTKQSRVFVGDIDICDTQGNYWNTFRIKVVVPAFYPFAVPTLFELSRNIKRKKSRHISEDGKCCVDVDHELLHWASRGISVYEFIKLKVYPFLANQLYYDSEKHYANGEYLHEFDGVRQFYSQKLNLDQPAIIVSILEMILANNLPGRNDGCPCGQPKFKFCHEKSVEFLKSVGAPKLISDLTEFKKLMA